MHHCLEVQKLIALICAEVADSDPPTESDRASLAALARTCQTFKNPALDALWRTQTSLAPLANLFPTKGEGKEVRLQYWSLLPSMSVAFLDAYKVCTDIYGSVGMVQHHYIRFACQSADISTEPVFHILRNDRRLGIIGDFPSRFDSLHIPESAASILERDRSTAVFHQTGFTANPDTTSVHSQKMWCHGVLPPLPQSLLPIIAGS